MMKEWLFRLTSRVPDRILDKVWGEECLLPYYHVVSDESIPHVSPLYFFRSVDQFKADIDHLLRRGRAISLGEFLDSVQATGVAPKRSFLLTFDDGFRETYDVVMPILIAKGVPAVFFLTSATLDNCEMCHHQKISLLLNQRRILGDRFADGKVIDLLSTIGIYSQEVDVALKSVPWASRAILGELGALCGVNFDDYLRRCEPYLTSEQVRGMLHNGFAIGAHSVDHPRYSDIAPEEQIRQTRESMETLVQKFGLKRRAFAFPHTDRGVSMKFFQTVFAEGTVEACFGTSGPAPACGRFCFQRFTMEKTDLPAKATIARSGMRRLKQRVVGNRHKPIVDWNCNQLTLS